MIDYNPHRWLDHLFDIEGSMVREISGRVSITVLWAVAVVAFHRFVHPVSIPPVVHTLVGVAIGLLLVFRTNASYDRFWEGRRQWGAIVNDSRNIGRSARVLLDAEPALLDSVLRWTAAYPYAVVSRLRPNTPFRPDTLGVPADEAAPVVASDHPPLAVAVEISRVFDRARRQGVITDVHYASLDAIVQRLIDAVGACERIHSTPLPYVYVVHLRRSLMAYCGTLPFAVDDAFGWGTVLVTFLVSYLFFGIEEIGVEIEDPFGTDINDLPLERYCDRIRANLAGLADRPLTYASGPAPGSTT